MKNIIITKGLYPYKIEIDYLNKEVHISTKDSPHQVCVTLDTWNIELTNSSHIPKLCLDKEQAANFLWWTNLSK